MHFDLHAVNENLRIQTLHDLLLLNTPREERFDRITAFAASEFDVPIVLISLVDQERVWYKSTVGVRFSEGARQESFCSHAVSMVETLIVRNALEDRRFNAMSVVLGEPCVRFYAGALLRLPNGLNVGTLCIMDKTTRIFDRMDTAILGGLRDLVVQELSNRN